jgi:hypothetical protein
MHCSGNVCARELVLEAYSSALANMDQIWCVSH